MPRRRPPGASRAAAARSICNRRLALVVMIGLPLLAGGRYWFAGCGQERMRGDVGAGSARMTGVAVMSGPVMRPSVPSGSTMPAVPSRSIPPEPDWTDGRRLVGGVAAAGHLTCARHGHFDSCRGARRRVGMRMWAEGESDCDRGSGDGRGERQHRTIHVPHLRRRWERKQSPIRPHPRRRAPSGERPAAEHPIGGHRPGS